MLSQKAQSEWTLTPLNHELRWKNAEVQYILWHNENQSPTMLSAFCATSHRYLRLSNGFHKYDRSSQFWNLWMKFMCLFSKLIAFINSLHGKIYCGTLPNMEKVWPGSMSMVVWRIASKWISCASLKFIDVKLELLNQWNYHVTWGSLTPLSMFMAQNSNCKWW